MARDDKERMSPEEFIKQANELMAQAQQMRARLNSIWSALSTGIEDWEKDLARAEFISLLKSWGDLAPLVDSWAREKEKEAREAK